MKRSKFIEEQITFSDGEAYALLEEIGRIPHPTRWSAQRSGYVLVRLPTFFPCGRVAPGGFHPEALTEPCVSLSTHTALASHSPTTS